MSTHTSRSPITISYYIIIGTNIQMLYTHLYVVIISVRIIMCVGVGGVTYWVFLFHFGPVLGTLVLCVCVCVVVWVGGVP